MEEKFKELVSRYCDMKPEEMTAETRFRDDLGMSSLDFMSLLGELEDEFDIDFEEGESVKIMTIGEALELLRRYL